MATLDPMSPEASPGVVSKKTGVRRVNNLPLYIFIGGVGLFLMIVLLVAYDRSNRQFDGADADANKAGNTSMYAKELAGNHLDGIIPPEVPPAAPVDLPPTPQPMDQPPRPVRYTAPPATNAEDAAEDETAARIAQAKRQQFEQAMRAKSTVPLTPMHGTGGGFSDPASPVPPSSPQETAARLAAMRQQSETPRSADSMAAYQARVAQLQAMGIGGGAAAGSLMPTASANTRNELAQFGGSGQSDRWRLNSRPDAPRTAYEMRAGFVIPATLISGINSQLPGQIVAQVSQNVYDTPTGKWLLIPQGTRLVGAYSSDVVYGQARVLVGWQRLVFPDGKAMDIGSMPGADSGGYAGFNDKVNNHYIRIFSSALLMSGVVAGVAYSQNRNPAATGSYAAPTASATMSQALGQELGQVTSQMIAKNLNIAPTLEIRPGYRFNVVVVKDLTFAKPYRAFDY